MIAGGASSEKVVLPVSSVEYILSAMPKVLTEGLKNLSVPCLPEQETAI